MTSSVKTSLYSNIFTKSYSNSIFLYNIADSRQLEALKLEMSYGFERVFLLSYCLACCWSGLKAKTDLRVIRQWAELDIVFPSEEARQAAVDKHYYIRENSVPIDVDVHHRTG